MEVTVHLPVSIIAVLISRALGEETPLELCKIYQYADLDSLFTVLYKKIAISVRGRGRRRLRAGGAAPGPWRNIANLHIMAGAFETLYISYTIRSVRYCSHRASLAFLLSKHSYPILTFEGPWVTLCSARIACWYPVIFRFMLTVASRCQPGQPV